MQVSGYIRVMGQLVLSPSMQAAVLVLSISVLLEVFPLQGGRSASVLFLSLLLTALDCSPLTWLRLILILLAGLPSLLLAMLVFPEACPSPDGAPKTERKNKTPLQHCECKILLRSKITTDTDILIKDPSHLYIYYSSAAFTQPNTSTRR